MVYISDQVDICQADQIPRRTKNNYVSKIRILIQQLISCNRNLTNMATWKMTAQFHFNPFKLSYLVLVLTLIVMCTSYVYGLHNRRTYHNREFNRFEPKKIHSYHHYEGHSKKASSNKNGKQALKIPTNNIFDSHGFDHSLHYSMLQGNFNGKF